MYAVQQAAQMVVLSTELFAHYCSKTNYAVFPFGLSLEMAHTTLVKRAAKSLGGANSSKVS